jgi:hypothetical protein
MEKKIVKPKLPNGDEVIKSLRRIEEDIQKIQQRVFLFRDKFEFPTMLAEIQELIEEKKLKNVTSEWIMRRYKIEYGRTARLMDKLKEKKLIK